MIVFQVTENCLFCLIVLENPRTVEVGVKPPLISLKARPVSSPVGSARELLLPQTPPSLYYYCSSATLTLSLSLAEPSVVGAARLHDVLEGVDL
jgi:hypothetical protein